MLTTNQDPALEDTSQDKPVKRSRDRGERQRLNIWGSPLGGDESLLKEDSGSIGQA
jgi:hypothetical protein